MSDYIDREKLINDGISKGFCDWYDEIKYAQKVKAIQLDKVKKVREEIFENVYKYSGSGEEVIQGYCDGFKACLKILDKLIAESEE